MTDWPGWIVGVDAGGTHTRVAAAPAADRLFRLGHGGGANWTVHGPEVCRERITSAIAQAVPPGEPLAALSLAVAGYYHPDHGEAAAAWAAECWPGVPVRVIPDVEAAHAGAFAGEGGLVIVSGTGSICYGANSRGQSARAGGWGPLFSDEGSAYTVGLGVLRCLARQVDRSAPRSPLAEHMMQVFPELGDTLSHWIRGVYRHRWGREQIAALAGEVVLLAEDGEWHSRELLEMAANDLAGLCCMVEDRLNEEGLGLVVQGGLGRASEVLRRELQRALSASGSRLVLREPLFSPLAGSLLVAASLLGLEARREARDRLERWGLPG